MDRGVLLPIASLPDGTFKTGYQFVDWLAKNNYKYWQILPLNPRDKFNSPYNTDDPFKIDSGYGTEKEWLALKKYANNKNIKIIGDLPFFVRRNSLDLFLPKTYSGAAPDFYSKKGQWWGHPIYDWNKKYQGNLEFFLKRIDWACQMFDIVRLDHFRGFVAVWGVPWPYKTGRHGHWVRVPGERILTSVRNRYPNKVFIAEDLGNITPAVNKLREKFDILSTKVLIWHSMKSVDKNTVLYSTVHDSNTLLGTVKSRQQVSGLVKKALESKAKIFIMPMQDILGLGSEARLNKPGKKTGNWKWKME